MPKPQPAATRRNGHDPSILNGAVRPSLLARFAERGDTFMIGGTSGPARKFKVVEQTDLMPLLHREAPAAAMSDKAVGGMPGRRSTVFDGVDLGKVDKAKLVEFGKVVEANLNAAWAAEADLRHRVEYLERLMLDNSDRLDRHVRTITEQETAIDVLTRRVSHHKAERDYRRPQ